MIFWLKNRQPEKWRDVHKIEHGKAGEFDNLTTEQLRERAIAAMKDIQQIDGQVVETNDKSSK